MNKIEVTLKPTIIIKGCTDKTCGDCRFWDEDTCNLFNKKTKPLRNKKYALTTSDGEPYFDMARLKECLEAENANSL